MSSGATRGEALADLRRAFEEGGLPSPALDARVLAAEAAGLDPIAFLAAPDAPLDPASARRIASYGKRRLAREPVARILGRSEFWGLPFRLSPATLVPRPDTETLVQAVLDRVEDRAARLDIVDFGTGAGCILVALLSEFVGSWGLGVDRSVEALATAGANAGANGVGERAAFVASDWGAALTGQVDIVVSNPPYISRQDLKGLDPEVGLFDPALALHGGQDGLGAYRRLIPQAKRLLRPAGLLALEIGYDQAHSVAGLAEAGGFAVLEVRRDLAGHPRALIASLS